MLVAVDIFSKFIKLFPMKNANAKAALNRIEKELRPMMPIKCILSDHGSQFTSKRWVKRLEELNIIPSLALIRHASSNPAKRYMNEIVRMLRTYCWGNQGAWAKIITDIEETLNNIPYSSTGYAPIVVLTGQKPSQLLDPIISKYLKPSKVPANKEIRQKVKENLIKNTLKRTRKQKVKTSEF